MQVINNSTELAPLPIPLSLGQRYALSRLVYGRGMLGRVESVSGKTQSQTSRTFYKSQIQSSGRSSLLSRDVTVPIFGDEIKPSERRKKA
jgi:hypothetical protein